MMTKEEKKSEPWWLLPHFFSLYDDKIATVVSKVRAIRLQLKICVTYSADQRDNCLIIGMQCKPKGQL
jgi:hypothetical protein